MKTYTYRLGFSPYTNTIRAKNIKDAFEKIAMLWPKYDVKKIVNICNVN